MYLNSQLVARPDEPTYHDSLLSVPTFYFVSIDTSILNCSIYGPQAKKYFDVITSDATGGSTHFYDHYCKDMALIDWEPEQAELEVHGIVPRQKTMQWLALNETRRFVSCLISIVRLQF